MAIQKAEKNLEQQIAELGDTDRVGSILGKHVKRIYRLGAEFRFRINGPSFFEDELTGKIRQSSPGKVFCDIVDGTIPDEHGRTGARGGGIVYATGEGMDQDLALEDALNQAEAAPKPMTQAQKFDVERQQSVIVEKDSRIAELEAKLARYESGSSANRSPEAPIQRRGGRKPRTTVEAEPSVPSGDS